MQWGDSPRWSTTNKRARGSGHHSRGPTRASLRDSVASVTDRRVGPFWPLGITFFAVAGLAVFWLTFASVYQMLSWPYQEWSGTSALFHQRLDLTGPVVAFVGAYFGGRLTPPTRPFARPKFPRDRGQFLAQNLVPLAVVVT